MADLAKLHANERIDLVDVSYVSDAVVRESRRVMRDVFVGDAEQRILDGFGFAIQFDDTTLRITRGKAIAASGVNAVVDFGQLVSEGQAQQDVAFAALGATLYGVWIKFQYADGTNANRKFYDVNANVEKTRMVKTRQVAGWIATTSETQPGDEWMQIATVDWDGASLAGSTLVDTRYFFFEGAANASPAFSSDWGGGDDRDNDRAAHGIKTLERFTQAMLKKLEEIQSDSSRWWVAPPQPLDQKVSRLGDLTLAGNYEITDGKLLLSGTGIGLEVLRVPGTGNPDPDVEPHAIFQTTNTANSQKVAAFFLHNGADLGRDGVALFSERVAEDDVDFKLGTIIDSAFGATKFTFDMDIAKFTAEGDILAHGGLASTGALPITGLGLSVVNPAHLQGDLQVDGVTTLAELGPVLMDSAGADVEKNILDADLCCKAWAIIQTDGAGGVTITEHKNVAAVGLVAYTAGPPDRGGCVRVALSNTNEFLTGNWMAQAQGWNNGDDGSSDTTRPLLAVYGCTIENGGTGVRKIHVYAADFSLGFTRNLDLNTVALKFSIAIFGKQ